MGEDLGTPTSDEDGPDRDSRSETRTVVGDPDGGGGPLLPGFETRNKRFVFRCKGGSSVRRGGWGIRYR